MTKESRDHIHLSTSLYSCYLKIAPPNKQTDIQANKQKLNVLKECTYTFKSEFQRQFSLLKLRVHRVILPRALSKTSVPSLLMPRSIFLSWLRTSLYLPLDKYGTLWLYSRLHLLNRFLVQSVSGILLRG